ncbi:MAG: hypothetical protein HYS87_01740 [Candidatus Colwellbacteria bacterium]|nr:hypothetical protein [Candidatus Colwellbacteria bacterium]
MNKNLLSTAGLVILVIIGVLFVPLPSPGYTAVTTISGEFFVGKAQKALLSHYIELKQPFVLQSIVGENQTPTPQLFNLGTDSYWLPTSVKINIKNIVIKGKVNPESPIAQALDAFNAPAPAPAPVEQETTETTTPPSSE